MKHFSLLHSHTLTACGILLALLLPSGVAQAGSPKLTRITPPGGQRGTTVEAFLHGRFLEEPRELMAYEPGIECDIEGLPEGEVEIDGRKQRVEPGTLVRVSLHLAADCPLGAHGFRLRTASGLTEYQQFMVGPFPSVDEEDSQPKRNDQPESAQDVPLNSTVVGRMNDAADVDIYRIEIQKGERLSAEIEAARIGIVRGVPDLHLAILDDSGMPLVEADDSAIFVQDPVISMIADRSGVYFVQVRHSIFNASNEAYRLHVGTFPRPIALYPAGGQAGTELTVTTLGDARGASKTTIHLPDRSGEYPFFAVDERTNVSAPSPNLLRLSPFPNVLEAEPNDSADSLSNAVTELPVAFNGVIEKPGDVDCFRFRATQGQRFRIYAAANAVGSPLDPAIWIKPVGASSDRGTLRASESNPNQLGLPMRLNRDTLDPVIDFNAPADGEYILGVEDEQRLGGSDYVYRVECDEATDAVYTYLPLENDNQNPQLRQAVTVAAGNRYNTQVSIFNTDRPFDGELKLVPVGLPKGVTMHTPRLLAGMTRVPVVFEAAADVKPQAAFIDLVVQPADESQAAKLVSGYRQVIPMNMYGQEPYLRRVADRLAVVVTEAAPFTIEVEQPKSVLVQTGELAVKYRIRRIQGFDGPLAVNMEWRPDGVIAAIPKTMTADQSQGEYLLGAARNAAAGTYQVTLTAISGAGGGNNDGVSRTYVCSQPFTLTVAEPHVEARFARTSIERGQTAQLVCKLTHLKPFTGKAHASLTRLPRGVEVVGPPREITSDDGQVEFTLRATSDALVGSYGGIALDLTVVEQGQSIRQLSGSGMLRIDLERGTVKK